MDIYCVIQRDGDGGAQNLLEKEMNHDIELQPYGREYDRACPEKKKTIYFGN